MDWEANTRGCSTLETFKKLDVVPANEADVNTFRKGGYYSIVHMTDFISVLVFCMT